MGVNKSKVDMGMHALGAVVDDFLDTCCNIDMSSSCRLDDLAFALALFIFNRRAFVES